MNNGTYALLVFGPEDHDTIFALVEIDDELKKTVAERRKLYVEARAKDSGLYTMRFWNAAVEAFKDEADDATGEMEFGDLTEDDCQLVSQELADELRKDEDRGYRTDNDMLVIGQDGFRWEFVGHYDDRHYETTEISYAELLNEADPKDVAMHTEAILRMLNNVNKDSPPWLRVAIDADEFDVADAYFEAVEVEMLPKLGPKSLVNIYLRTAIVDAVRAWQEKKRST